MSTLGSLPIFTVSSSKELKDVIMPEHIITLYVSSSKELKVKGECDKYVSLLGVSSSKELKVGVGKTLEAS